jgi:hypothetical protein
MTKNTTVTQHLLNTGFQMRVAQQRYFKTRAQADLIASKTAEAAFDFALKAALSNPTISVSHCVNINGRHLSTTIEVDLFTGQLAEYKFCDGVPLNNGVPNVRMASAA